MNSILNNDALFNAYDPEEFRKTGYKIVDMLANYLTDVKSGNVKQVLPFIPPNEMLNHWPANFSNKPSGNIENLLNKFIKQSNHLHHPCYAGHQVTAALPASALCDLAVSFLNNGTAIYEMGQVGNITEKSIAKWMSGLIGYDDNADGFFTSGGTLGNLTALLAARQVMAGYDIWTDGVKDDSQLAVLVSEQCHYSVKRAIQIMGIGEIGAISVPSNELYQMDTEKLEEIYEKAVKHGKKVIAVVGSACSTATGSYDDLEFIGNFCQKYNLWFHVDGAHGAPALLSDKYKHLLKGIEKADSVVWDAHKMMLVASLCTAVLFKNGDNSYESFSQKASYLFEKNAREEWYNLGHRTMECTKNLMGIKLYVCLSVYGTDMFADYVTRMYDLTGYFADAIENSQDFELAITPQSNIICFRYIPEGAENLNELQKEIRRKLVESGEYYIVQTMLKDKAYLRCTVISPLTGEKELDNLLKTIREIA